ncbi:hypothetical protein [Thermogymnomonas acidicola]|uniref:hypothetical protein n=1 Tax=Thermogymnomonas acidicola TaxID=399579 RepID=UPI00094661D1|nr:hypothetical protein [Thermogymnomonas acidicola]
MTPSDPGGGGLRPGSGTLGLYTLFLMSSLTLCSVMRPSAMSALSDFCTVLLPRPVALTMAAWSGEGRVQTT